MHLVGHAAQRHSNNFTALLEILDPQRFCRGVPVHPDQLADVMVRRLKADVRELVPGEFAERIIEPIIIEGLPEDAPELELSRLLPRLREVRSEHLASTNKSRRSAAMLVNRQWAGSWGNEGAVSANGRHGQHGRSLRAGHAHTDGPHSARASHGQ